MEKFYRCHFILGCFSSMAIHTLLMSERTCHVQLFMECCIKLCYFYIIFWKPISVLWVRDISTKRKKVLCTWDRWFPHPAKNAICLPWFGIISIIILGAAIGRPAREAARRATVISPWFPFTSQNSQPDWSQHFWKAGVRIPPPPTTSFVIAVDSICRRFVGCRKCGSKILSLPLHNLLR